MFTSIELICFNKCTNIIIIHCNITCIFSTDVPAFNTKPYIFCLLLSPRPHIYEINYIYNICWLIFVILILIRNKYNWNSNVKLLHNYCNFVPNRSNCSKIFEMQVKMFETEHKFLKLHRICLKYKPITIDLAENRISMQSKLVEPINDSHANFLGKNCN